MNNKDEIKEIQRYVEELFLRKEKTKEIIDLQEEILSNMYAKYEDLLLQGVPKNEAVARVKKDVDDSFVSNITGGKDMVKVINFYETCTQQVLLACIIMWILSIPTMIYYGSVVSSSMLFLVICCGILYLVLHFFNQDKTKEISIAKVKKIRNYGWLIWILLAMVKIIVTFALQFGSNIWFHRPIYVDGPYQFGSILVRYYIVGITILIPIAISTFPKILKQKVDDKG